MPSRESPPLTRSAGQAARTAGQVARTGRHSARNAAIVATGKLDVRRDAVPAGSDQGQTLHHRRRRHAGRPFAAHEQAAGGEPDGAVPLAALAQSVALHVLLRLRGLPRRRRFAGNPRPPRRRHGHRAADRRHAPARRLLRGRSGAGRRAAGRREGTCRACPAARPRPQRRRPRRSRRHHQAHREHDRRALLARDAHRLERRRRSCGPD
jgi:hypothetical protein